MLRFVSRCLVVVVACLLLSTSASADPFPGPDMFGYTGSVVPFPGLVDISGTGTSIASGDDNAGTVNLGGPGFNYYGTIYNQLRAATNGYISTDLTDLGGDLTNDDLLPAAPSTGGGGRIYALHDDLVSTVYHQYFPNSPYANPGGSASSANVLQWDNTSHFGGGGPFDFQTVLFDDGNILFLYGAGNPETGLGSTTGIQDPTFTKALQYSANTAGSIPDNFALFIQHPDAQLQVIPEPASVAVWSVVGLIGCAYGLRRWRRRSQTVG